MLPLSTSIKLKKSNPIAPSESGCCGSRRDCLCAVERLGDQRNRRLPAITPSRKSNAQRTIKTRGTLFAQRPGILLRCICLLNLHSLSTNPRANLRIVAAIIFHPIVPHDFHTPYKPSVVG